MLSHLSFLKNNHRLLWFDPLHSFLWRVWHRNLHVSMWLEKSDFLVHQRLGKQMGQAQGTKKRSAAFSSWCLFYSWIIWCILKAFTLSSHRGSCKPWILAWKEENELCMPWGSLMKWWLGWTGISKAFEYLLKLSCWIVLGWLVEEKKRGQKSLWKERKGLV